MGTYFDLDIKFNGGSGINPRSNGPMAEVVGYYRECLSNKINCNAYTRFQIIIGDDFCIVRYFLLMHGELIDIHYQFIDDSAAIIGDILDTNKLNIKYNIHALIIRLVLHTDRTDNDYVAPNKCIKITYDMNKFINFDI